MNPCCTPRAIRARVGPRPGPPCSDAFQASSCQSICPTVFNSNFVAANEPPTPPADEGAEGCASNPAPCEGAVPRPAASKPGRRPLMKNRASMSLSGITLYKNAETGISLAITEISAEVSLLIPTYPELYRVIPSYTRGISLDIQLQESYPCISQNNFSIQTYTGYPGISHRSGYPKISLYKSGFGKPTLPPDVFACWSLPCGVTWDAVPKQSWLLRLLLTPLSRYDESRQCQGLDPLVDPSAHSQYHALCYPHITARLLLFAACCA